jgi:uncharacterized protein (TIGR02217 family)
MPEFLEERLPDEIRMGAQVRDSFDVQITRTASGAEHRRLIHPIPMRRFVINFTGMRDDTIKRVLDLYARAHGRYAGFRVRWPDDCTTATDGRAAPSAFDHDLALVSAGVYQMQKAYGLGSSPGPSGYPMRTIFKPVAGTVRVAVGGVLPTLGWSSVSTTGRVTFAANKTRAITFISKAVQAVISCAGHTFLAGESVHISGVVGMVEINGLRGLIVSIVANVSITVAINTSGGGFTAYTSGGTANTRPQAGESVQGGCEFDLPCRFDSDVDTTLLTRSVREIGSMEVVELLNP